MDELRESPSPPLRPLTSTELTSPLHPGAPVDKCPAVLRTRVWYNGSTWASQA